MSDMRGVGGPVFGRCVRAVVDALDARAGVHISFADARDLVAHAMGIKDWKTLLDLDVAQVADRQKRLQGQAGRRRLQELVLSRLGVQLSDKHISIATRALLGYAHAKPSDYVVPVKNRAGEPVGLFLNAIGRAEHSGRLDSLFEQLGFTERLNPVTRCLNGNALIPETPVFYEWTSKSVSLSGEPRALLIFDHGGLGKRGTRAQLDEQLDFWGFVPYVRFIDDDAALTTDQQRLHASWSDDHVHVGASGEHAVRQLRFLAQAFDRHDLALLHTFAPCGRRNPFNTGLYLLAASVVGAVDVDSPSKWLAVDGPLPPGVSTKSWTTDD
jgi:hypothetical protein